MKPSHTLSTTTPGSEDEGELVSRADQAGVLVGSGLMLGESHEEEGEMKIRVR